jgi:hypothetical protein
LITVTVTGGESIRGASRRLVDPIVNELPEPIAQFGATSARRGVPRATGRTATTIAAKASGAGKATLRAAGATRFVEFGSRGRQPRRFMLRAFHDMAGQANSEMAKAAKTVEGKWKS